MQIGTGSPIGKVTPVSGLEYFDVAGKVKYVSDGIAWYASAGDAASAPAPVAISNGVGAPVLSLQLAAGQAAAGKVSFKVIATDGSGNVQCGSGELRWSAVNVNGTVTFDRAPVAEIALASPTGTLAIDLTAAISGSSIVVNLVATSSLTTPTLSAMFTQTQL